MGETADNVRFVGVEFELATLSSAVWCCALRRNAGMPELWAVDHWTAAMLNKETRPR